MEKEKKVLEALTCPNCNGEVELDKNQEFGFCKYCGTKYSSLSSLTANSCSRHPNGPSKGKHSPAL